MPKPERKYERLTRKEMQAGIDQRLVQAEAEKFRAELDLAIVKNMQAAAPKKLQANFDQQVEQHENAVLMAESQISTLENYQLPDDIEQEVPESPDV